MKRRKEKFNPTNDTTMVEKIEERSKKDREASEEVIASEEPLPATTRNFLSRCLCVAAKSMEELRERLNAKIEMLRKNRIEAAKKNDKQQKERSKKRAASTAAASQGGEKEKRVKTTASSDKTSEKASEKDENQKQQEKTTIAAPSVDDVITKYDHTLFIVSCIECDITCSLQFGKVKTVVEADTSLRPKKRKDLHTLLKQAQKKQEHLKQLKSTEAGMVGYCE